MKILTQKVYRLDSNANIFHKEDGPAVTIMIEDDAKQTHQIKQWFVYNISHRMDGPSMEETSALQWTICGLQVSSKVHAKVSKYNPIEFVLWYFFTQWKRILVTEYNTYVIYIQRFYKFVMKKLKKVDD